MSYDGLQIASELRAAGVPVIAADDTGRLAFGLPHKTKTGQWVQVAAGGLQWVGTGTRAPKPTAHLATIATTKAAHVPAPPSPPPLNTRRVLRALAAKARGRATPAQETLLDRAEAQD